jgi:hypothetical protein
MILRGGVEILRLEHLDDTTNIIERKKRADTMVEMTGQDRGGGVAGAEVAVAALAASEEVGVGAEAL